MHTQQQANGAGLPAAYTLPVTALLLTRAMRDCGVRDEDAARAFGIGRTTWLLVRTRRGYYPGYAAAKSRKQTEAERAAFRQKVEAWVWSHPRLQAWLRERGLEPQAIWEETEPAVLHRAMPAGFARHGYARPRPDAEDAPNDEGGAVMIDSRILKHYRLFRNPFTLPIESDRDLYWGDEQQYVYDCCWQVAHDAGFGVVVGEVGSGKSTIRQKLFRDLAKEDVVTVLYPQMIDRARMTAEYIADAILYDLEGPETRIPRVLERKARAVQQALAKRHADGRQHLLVIEEAHLLPTRTLRYLKQYWELTADPKLGGDRLLGILLIGQPELRERLKEGLNWEIREMIRRCQLIELGPLNGDTRAYLQHLLKRAGGQLERVMTAEAVDALVERLKVRDETGRRTVSRTYPLTLQGCLVRAMHEAARRGRPKVEAELIQELVF